MLRMKNNYKKMRRDTPMIIVPIVKLLTREFNERLQLLKTHPLPKNQIKLNLIKTPVVAFQAFISKSHLM